MKEIKRLSAVIFITLIAIFTLSLCSSASAVSYYQTVKNDVPIWSAASSKSTKVDTLAYSGTVVKVVASTTNSSGNLWYKLNNGTWVFSGNVTGHSHSYNNAGYCTGRNCGYEWPYTIYSASGTYQVTNTSGAKIWSRPYSNSSTHYRTLPYGSTLTINGRTTNKEGNVWYRLTDGSWVFSGNVKQRFAVYFNANGGSGAPSTQYALADTSFTLSSVTPTRAGHFFRGWATSSSASSAKYYGGRSYRLSGNVTLYAVWKKCAHSSYTGGYCDSCGYQWAYTISSASGTYQVINTNGAKIWSRPYSNKSTHYRTLSYGSTLTINARTTNKEGNIWYRLTDGSWVFSGNVKQRFAVYFNANGGSGAPSTQYVLAGSSLTLSSQKPTKSGSTFKGWATSASATSPKYYGGRSYSVSSNVTLYAVWGTCSHSSYTGGYCDSCSYQYPVSVTSVSGTYIVTNSEGAKIWTRPYSKKSTHVRTENKDKKLTVTGKTTNADNNLWYRLSDGYWVYSGNVAKAVTVTYNANGGSGAPSAQVVKSGSSLKLSSTKPKKTGYSFKGWTTAANSTKVIYKAGTSYKFSKNMTLYAVWGTCSHSSYSGGYCSTCSYEYPVNVTSASGTYIVTNSKGAKIWTRPYSNKSTHLRTASKGTALTVTGKTTNAEKNLWYKLSDGNWVYSGNIAKQLTVTFNANTGTGAPGPKTATKGEKVTAPKMYYTKYGYKFKGWTTSATSTEVKYKAGSKITLQKNLTLYAVWEKCSYMNTSVIKKSRPVVEIPGLTDGFVPQGICYVESLGKFAVSGYVDDSQSRIYLVDAATGASQMFKLKYTTGSGKVKNFTGHAGGIASYGSDIWVASGGSENSGGYIYHLDISAFARATDNNITFDKRFQTVVKASGLYCDGNTLWVNEFYDLPDYPVNRSHYRGKNHAWACGYNLPVEEFAPDELLIPDVILSIPDKVQGMCITDENDVIFSTSHGRDKDSYLRVYSSYKKWSKSSVTLTGNKGNVKVPLYVPADKNLKKKITMPTLMEGLDFYNGKMYVIFESGAKKYNNAKENISSILETDIKKVY